MKIKVNNRIEKSFKKIVQNLSRKKIFGLILLLLFIFIFGVGCLFYGAYLNSSGQTYNLKLALIRLSNFDFSFIPNTIVGQSAHIEQFAIDVSFKNWEKIKYNREKALLLGKSILNEYKEEVPAKIRFNNQTFNVKISLTGGNHQHINHPDTWSLMIKVKNGKTIMGMNKFAILYPRARGYLTDWFATKILESRGLLGIKTGFVKIKINGKDHGLYYLEERFDNKLLETSKRFHEGVVFRIIGSNLKIYGFNKIKDNKKLLKDVRLLKQLWYSFLNNSIKPEKIFDLKKFASLYVCTDIMYNPSKAHALWHGNIRFYFNPITKMVEPIAREWGDIREDGHVPLKNLLIEAKLPEHFVLQNKIVDNMLFKEFYIKEAVKLSKVSFLDSLIKIHKQEMNDLLAAIYSQNPFYKFPYSIIYENQKNIYKKLYPFEPPILVYFDSIINNNLILHVANKSNLPIEIHRLVYNDSKNIELDNRIIILPKYKDSDDSQEIQIPLKQKKNIALSKFSIDSTEVIFSILGISETIKNYNRHIFTSKTIIFPKDLTKNDYSNQNPMIKSPNINKFDFLIVNDNEKTIQFSNKKCDVQMDLIIPKGYFVSAKPGCKINLTNSARIISYSPILFFGKSDSLISITSSDSTGQGMVLLNCNSFSEFSHVSFENLSNISDFDWDLTSAVTFYESPVTIKNCTFKNNFKGDNYLNTIRTDFNVINTTFYNVFADAFDSDYCEGSIKNTKFLNVGNNAIDISGTMLKIDNIIVDNVGNKGLSVNENSQLIANNVNISNSEIAVCSSDISKIIISNSHLINSKIGFAAFQKKTEFGPSSIEGSKIENENVSIPYLIETSSNCKIDGENKTSVKDKVKDILYNVKYGDSSK